MRLWKFFQEERKGICRARRRVSGPDRRTVQFCWAIRRPSTRTIRTRIAAYSPKRCSCRAVACGDRGVSRDMGLRPLVRRRWRRGSPSPECQGMPPPAPRPPRSPRQSWLRSRTVVRPVVPRERSEGFTRPPHCRVRMSPTAVLCRPSASLSIRPRRLRIRRRGQSVPDAGASPRRLQNAVATRKRHLDVVNRKLRLPRSVPDSRRLSGCPVWPRWLPTHRPRAAQNGVSVPLAPRRQQNRMLSSLAVVALQRRLAPRHYRNSETFSPPRNCSQRPAATGG